MPVTKNIALVIDDDQIIVDMVKAALIHEGYEVVCAYDGIEGLEIAQTSPLDIIILDRRMPEADGDEVLEKLKSMKETSSVPVVMLTGDNDVAGVQKSLALGAEDYIVKPFLADDLIMRVQRVTGGFRRVTKRRGLTGG